MQHRADQAVEKTFLQFFQEVFLVEIIGDVAIGQVPELVGVLEVVHRDDVVFAALVERLDQVGTDKPGGAGDDVVHLCSFRFFWEVGRCCAPQWEVGSGKTAPLLPTSYFLLPTSYFQLPTAYFLLPTSYFLLPTSYCIS